MIERARHKKVRHAKRGPGQRKPAGSTIDIKATLLHAELHEHTLRFRLRVDAEGSARPREVVEALLGERLPDHLTTRERIPVRKDGELVGIAEAGARGRRPSRERAWPRRLRRRELEDEPVAGILDRGLLVADDVDRPIGRDHDVERHHDLLLEG